MMGPRVNKNFGYDAAEFTWVDTPCGSVVPVRLSGPTVKNKAGTTPRSHVQEAQALIEDSRALARTPGFFIGWN
jgi:hypothetical protein